MLYIAKCFLWLSVKWLLGEILFIFPKTCELFMNFYQFNQITKIIRVFTGNCMSEFMGLITGTYEAKVCVFEN